MRQRLLDHGDAILSVREKKKRKKQCLIQDLVSMRKPMHHHLSPTKYKILTGLLRAWLPVKRKGQVATAKTQTAADVDI